MDLFFDKSFGILIVAAFGLAFGSFATMASYRIPLGEDLVFKPSNCPKCKHRLGFWDLIPVFSWLFNMGKCRYCKAKVSIRYPLTELVMAALFVVVYLKFGIGLQGFAMFALVVCLVIMVVVDIEHQIIPDSVQLVLIPIGLLYRYSTGSEWIQYFSGPVLGLAIALSLRYWFWLWKKKEGLGMGDVKFFAVAGLFLGVKAFVPFMLFAGLAGIITSFIWKAFGGKEEFPFGPALALSMLTCLMFPEYIAVLYNFSF